MSIFQTKIGNYKFNENLGKKRSHSIGDLGDTLGRNCLERIYQLFTESIVSFLTIISAEKHIMHRNNGTFNAAVIFFHSAKL